MNGFSAIHTCASQGQADILQVCAIHVCDPWGNTVVLLVNVVHTLLTGISADIFTKLSIRTKKLNPNLF